MNEEEIKISSNAIKIGNKILYGLDRDLLKFIEQLQQENKALKEKEKQGFTFNKNFAFNAKNNKTIVPTLLRKKSNVDLIKKLQQENRILYNMLNEFFKYTDENPGVLQNPYIMELMHFLKSRDDL